MLPSGGYFHGELKSHELTYRGGNDGGAFPLSLPRVTCLRLLAPCLSGQTVAIRNVSYPGTALEVGETVGIAVGDDKAFRQAVENRFVKLLVRSQGATQLRPEASTSSSKIPRTLVDSNDVSLGRAPLTKRCLLHINAFELPGGLARQSPV
jgi:hypothetical protein